MTEKFSSILKDKHDLTYNQAVKAMNNILQGKNTTSQNVDFMTNLYAKGETDAEILGMLDSIDSFCVPVPLKDNSVIDMCGTGGDGLNTFNISTAASFVAASAGAIVAKHGNRSSSYAGSADIFEWLNYDLSGNALYVSDFLQETHLCFMFAPTFHSSMKHVAIARRQIPHRTIFNILGPLCNPARVKNQVIGVSAEKYLHSLPPLLINRGANRIMTIISSNGMDELSSCDTGKISFQTRDSKTNQDIIPENLGLRRSTLSELSVTSLADAISKFINGVKGTGTRGMTDTIALNAAAGLAVSGIASNIQEGLDLALDVMNSGKSEKLLLDFMKKTGCKQKLDVT